MEMRPRSIALACCCILLLSLSCESAPAEVVKSMFYHSYDSYLRNAFPLDELKPISCKGHDTLGGYTLTLFDALDSLAVFQNKTEFSRVVKWISENVNFDRDRTVSVFETNIRVLGSLISGHLLASDKSLSLMEDYNNELLPLARDLGDRLLKAFKSPTNLPYGSVNLRRGVNKGETPISATATAGTILLEFGLLSKITEDEKYIEAAKRATRELWKRRSSIGLLASHINVETGEWVYFDSGVSGGIDSFFEYLLKAHLIFGDEEWLDMFEEGYRAILTYVKRGPFYPDVHMSNGQIMFPYYRSLQSFWPGLQAIYGDVKNASDTFAVMFSVWNEFGFVPEAYNLQKLAPEEGLKQYPLRPELAESAFYLYRVTGDEKYRDAAAKIIDSLLKHAKVECGFAAVENVETKELRDHMDSYFLAETLKYLYLIFDESPETAVFRDPTKYIFNTEAHLLPLSAPPADEFLTRPGHVPNFSRRISKFNQPGPQKRGWKRKRSSSS